jgi:hypothetical protein
MYHKRKAAENRDKNYVQSVLDIDNVYKDNGLNKDNKNPMGHRMTDRR